MISTDPMEGKILSILREKGDFVSGQALCGQLGVSRTAVWKAVNRLRARGYQIDSATNRGYRLVQMPSGLSREGIAPRLPKEARLLFYSETDSTNTRAKALAASGAPEGTVLVADCQTGGRGRRGRSFFSPPGTGVYLSVILRPACAPMELMHLTCAAAVAACDAVEKVTGLRPGIKWTNDLVIGKKKLAGILTELALEAESGQVQYAVIGIGVNCCQEQKDFPPELAETATSLSLALGREVDRNALAAGLAEEFLEMGRTLVSQKAEILARYRADCVTLGQEVCLVSGDSLRHGFALDVDGEGALTVRLPDGSVENVRSGEVSVRGMYGYV